MVINFICRASKADKSGQLPLEVSIIINGVRRYVHLDRKVKAADFNPKTQKVKRDASTNEYLVALRTKLYSLETEMLRNGMEVTIDTFIDAFKNGLNPNTSTLLKMFEFHNEEYATKRAQNVISYSTLLKYNVTKNYFAKYLKEKHNKADILVKDNVSPVGRMTFVLSKLIPYWIAGLLVLTIAMLIGGLVYGVWPAGSVGAVILAAMLFIIVMSALGIVIASKSATMLQSILVMFAIIMIFQLMGGLFTPISSMPGWAQAITYAVPPRYFIEIVRDIYLKGSTVADLTVPYLTLTAIAAALSLLAALTYKKQA